jgi:periplasmic protein TonB
MVSAAVHLLAAALLWVSGWWPGSASDLVMPYPPEQDYASVSIPPASSQSEEAASPVAVEISPQFQSPETRPLEPTEVELVRSEVETLLEVGIPVTHASPADEVGEQGAPRIDRPRKPAQTDRERSDELPEVGMTTGSISRTTSGVESRMIPRALLNPAPTYPREALARRLEGVVLVQVTVDAGGEVTQVRLARTSGVGSLDEAALTAVRQWRFLPARHPNTPPRRVNIPIEFVIRDR